MASWVLPAIKYFEELLLRTGFRWPYAWKNTNQIACITKKGDNEFELVTPAGSGKGSFVGNGYFSGVAGGRTVNCVGRSVTNTGIGVCSD
jgi:hypothetical protein